MRRGIVIAGMVLLLTGCGGGTAAKMLDSFSPSPEQRSALGAEVAYASTTAAAAADTADSGRKIIRNASIDLEVADPEEGSRSVARLAEQFGGYVSDEQTYRQATGNDEATFSQLQVRVPADSLGDFLDALEGEALDVRSRSVSSQDISEQYSDVQAQLTNLNAYEAELRLLLSDVRDRPNAKPEDLLTVFEDIRQVRGEIEQLQGRQRLYDSQVALATVSVTLTPSEVVAPIAREGWDAGSILRQALRGLVVALQSVASAMIWLGAFGLPILILVLVPIALVVWLVRRRRRSGGAAPSEVPAD
jgi:hypothetical protein